MRSHGLLLGVGGVALCAWCGWASAYHRSTAPAEIVWVISLGAVVAVDLALWSGARRTGSAWHLQRVQDPWPRPGRGGGRLALRGLAPWIVILVVAAAWDVLGLDTGPRQAHVTISALAQAYRPLNAAVLLAWMLAGIGYGAARARAPALTSPSPAQTDPDAPERGTAFGMGMAALGAHPAGPGLLLPSNRPLGIAFWVAVPLAGVLVDLTARRSGGRVATAEECIRFISDSTVANIALIAAWVFAGYHLFAR